MFGLFKKYDVHLCSEVKGRILDNGLPVSGLTVHRWLGYTDEVEREDFAVTDDNGEFYFPEYSIRSKLPGRAFVESLTTQVIYIKKGDKNLPLWDAVLEGIHPIEVFNDKLAWLNCDLTNEQVDFEFDDIHLNRKRNATSICRWDKNFTIY